MTTIVSMAMHWWWPNHSDSPSSCCCEADWNYYNFGGVVERYFFPATTIVVWPMPQWRTLKWHCCVAYVVVVVAFLSQPLVAPDRSDDRDGCGTSRDDDHHSQLLAQVDWFEPAWMSTDESPSVPSCKCHPSEGAVAYQYHDDGSIEPWKATTDVAVVRAWYWVRAMWKNVDSDIRVGKIDF